MTEKVYTGTIVTHSWGEDDDALFLEQAADPNVAPLAWQVEEDIEEHGNTVTVQYWITDEPRTLEQMLENEAKKAAGALDAEYHQHYSDITGYLWTDASLMIGGHDLLAELQSHEGRWCRLSIRFDERPDVDR